MTRYAELTEENADEVLAGITVSVTYQVFPSGNVETRLVEHPFIKCDTCGATWSYDVWTNDPDDAARLGEQGLRSDGWSLCDDSDKDYCPDCVAAKGL